jgi:hypothetical protein
LEHEGSGFTNGLVHWWIHNLMPLLGGGGVFQKWSLVEPNRSLGMFPWQLSCPHPILALFFILNILLYFKFTVTLAIWQHF